MKPAELTQRLTRMGWVLLGFAALCTGLAFAIYEPGDNRLGVFCISGLFVFLGLVCLAGTKNISQ